MYAIAIIRYRRSLEEVLVHQDAHRAYLRGLKEKGVLVASGPCNPRFGGILLLRVGDDDFTALDAVRDSDPFIQHAVAQYELLGWNPVKSTFSAGISTAIGGFIPIIPFFFTVGMPAVIASFIISTIAHFAVGASKALITTRPWWASGLEMTLVGIIEAAVTYGLGLALAQHGPALQ